MESNQPINGFTLVELLVYIALFGIFVVGIFSLFQSSQKSYTTVSRTVELRQNLRATVDYMTNAFRMAGNSGYDTTTNSSGILNTGFITAARNTVSFSEDADMDGVANTIAFSLAAGDSDNDGIVDSGTGTTSLQRTLNGVTGIVMDDVQGVQFAYAFDNNNDTEIDYIDANTNSRQDSGEEIWAYDTNGDGLLDTQIDGTALPETVSFKKIRMIRIWILGRTAAQFNSHADSRTYTLGGISLSGNNDKHRRYLLSTTIKCRNMGT